MIVKYVIALGFCLSSLSLHAFFQEKVPTLRQQALKQGAIKLIKESEDDQELIQKIIAIKSIEESEEYIKQGNKINALGRKLSPVSNMLAREIVSPRITVKTPDDKKAFISSLLKKSEFEEIHEKLLDRDSAIGATPAGYRHYLENFPDMLLCNRLRIKYDLCPHYILRMFFEIEAYDKAKMFIEWSNIPDILISTGIYSSTVLHNAISFRDIEKVKKIVELGGFNEKKDGRGFTPLDLARKNRVLEIVKLLEEHIAKRNSHLSLPVFKDLFANEKKHSLGATLQPSTHRRRKQHAIEPSRVPLYKQSKQFLIDNIKSSSKRKKTML